MHSTADQVRSERTAPTRIRGTPNPSGLIPPATYGVTSGPPQVDHSHEEIFAMHRSRLWPVYVCQLVGWVSSEVPRS